MAGSRTKTTQQQQDDEQAPWEVPPAEGDPSIGEGQQLEVAAEVVAPRDEDTLQNLMDWCIAYVEEHAVDNAAVMAAEVRRIMAGEDAEAVLSESAPLSGKDHTDKPFMLHGFTLQPTDFTDGWPFYANIDATVPGTGTTFVLNCGGVKVIAALRRLHELGEYPYPVKVKGNETRAGRTVLALVMAGA